MPSNQILLDPIGRNPEEASDDEPGKCGLNTESDRTDTDEDELLENGETCKSQSQRPPHNTSPGKIPPLRRCNGSIVTKIKEEFDYTKYTKFRQLQNEFDQEIRRVWIKNGQKALTAEECTEPARMDLLLTQTYGPLDKESQHYMSIYDRFVASYFQMVNKWEVLEKGSAYLKPLCRKEEIEQKIVSTFTAEDILSFDLNPYTNKGKADWFILPRPKLKLEDFALHTRGQPRADNTSPGLNLALFDPFFVVYNGWSSSVFAQSDVIPPIARQRFAERISDYPLGVTPHIFFDSLPIPFGFKIWNIDFKTETDVFKKADDLAYIPPLGQTALKSPLIFPPYQEGIMASFPEIVYRIWHRIKILLTLHNSHIEVREIQELYELAFGHAIHPMEWGLSGWGSFVEYLSKKFSDTATSLVNCDEGQSEAKRKTKCLVRVIPDEGLRMSTSDWKPVPIPVPIARKKNHNLTKIPEIGPEFVQFDDVCPYVSDRIMTLSYIRCIPGEIISPSKFYVNFVENWEDLEKFMKDLQREMSPVQIADMKSMTPDPRCLKKGLHILAFHEHEWYRARIISRMKGERFRVMLIDYGKETTVELKDIKYMKLDKFQFPIQAVECRLMFNILEDMLEMDWSDHEEGKTLLTNLVKDTMLGVQFNERTSYLDFTLGAFGGRTQSWLVAVNILGGSTSSLRRCCEQAEGETGEERKSGGSHQNREFVTDIQDFNISKRFTTIILREQERLAGHEYAEEGGMDMDNDSLDSGSLRSTTVRKFPGDRLWRSRIRARNVLPN